MPAAALPPSETRRQAIGGVFETAPAVTAMARGRSPVRDPRAATPLTCAGQVPAARPGVELGLERIDRPLLVVHVAVHGHGLALLPALDRRDITAEVGRDLFPRVEAPVGLPVGSGVVRRGGVTDGGVRHRANSTVGFQGRQSTAFHRERGIRPESVDRRLIGRRGDAIVRGQIADVGETPRRRPLTYHGGRGHLRRSHAKARYSHAARRAQSRHPRHGHPGGRGTRHVEIFRFGRCRAGVEPAPPDHDSVERFAGRPALLFDDAHRDVRRRQQRRARLQPLSRPALARRGHVRRARGGSGRP